MTIVEVCLIAGVLTNAIVGIGGLWATLQGKETIRKLETNTNSIKDALVKTTGEAAHAAGLAEGKKEGK